MVAEGPMTRRSLMKAKVCLSILLMLPVITLLSAQDELPDRKGKFFLVPELWLSFGTTTYVEASPQVGYHVTDRFVVGLGPHYLYQALKATPYYPISFKSHAYGMKCFVRYALITRAEEYLPVKIFNDLFVHLEYEGISLEKENFYAPTFPTEGRFIYQGILLGGGLSQRVGLFNSVSLMVLWDLNESNRSPYTNPLFRVGFNTYF